LRDELDRLEPFLSVREREATSHRRLSRDIANVRSAASDAPYTDGVLTLPSRTISL